MSDIQKRTVEKKKEYYYMPGTALNTANVKLQLFMRAAVEKDTQIDKCKGLWMK